MSSPWRCLDCGATVADQDDPCTSSYCTGSWHTQQAAMPDPWAVAAGDLDLAELERRRAHAQAMHHVRLDDAAELQHRRRTAHLTGRTP